MNILLATDGSRFSQAAGSLLRLIGVGHRGKSVIERLLLGSVASRIVHHASCSVWVVRG
jgi:hypothetical protein